MAYLFLIFIPAVFLNKYILSYTTAYPPYTVELDGEEIFFPLVGLYT